MLVFSIPSDRKSIKKATSKILTYIEDMNLREKLLFNVRMCCEEAIINAIKHGNAYDSDLMVKVSVSKTPEYLKISVKDQGKGFDVSKVSNPTAKENLLKLSGRGVHLMRNYMDEVSFSEKGNRVTMMKYIKKANRR